MDSTVTVTCPYCFQRVELFVDPDTEGSYVEDCEICCRPWQVTVSRDGDRLDVVVDRAQ